MPDQTIYPLFVYGSLMSGFKSPAYEYISRFFNLVGKAKVKGKLYDMGEYPAAIPTNDDGFIQGELYQIKNEAEFSWAIGQLDDYEGVTPEPGEEQLYRRELASHGRQRASPFPWQKSSTSTLLGERLPLGQISTHRDRS